MGEQKNLFLAIGISIAIIVVFQLLFPQQQQTPIKNSGGEYSSFIESFIKDDDVKIEGLINDSDVYDFYLKYTDDIDVILNDITFFDESPSNQNVFGLYNYLVLGTNESIKEIVKNLYELNKNSEKDT